MLIGSGLLVGLNLRTLHELQRSHLLRQRSQAENVARVLEERLSGGLRDLQRFTTIPADSQRSAALPLLERLSAIYLLDASLRLKRIHKQEAFSRLFPGFGFRDTRLGRQLAEAESGSGLSPLIPAYEDERAGLYIWHRQAEGLWLARIDLSHVQALLRDFNRLSGAQLLLVSREGFVMLSGSPQLIISDVSVPDWQAMAHSGRTIQLGTRLYLPLAVPSRAIGAWVVCLVHAEPLARERELLVGGAMALAAGIGLLLALRYLSMRRHLLEPVAGLARQLQAVEEGRTPLAACSASHSRYREIEMIQRRCRAMALAVKEREEGLLEAQRREQHAADRQRLELEERLRTGLAASTVAHELQQPLSALVLSNRLMEQHCRRHGDTALAASLEPLLRTQHEEGERMVATVGVMRELLGRSPGQQSAIDLSELVRISHGGLVQLGEIPDSVGVTFSGFETPCWVMGSGEELRIAIDHLLRNGVASFSQIGGDDTARHLGITLTTTATTTTATATATAMVQLAIGGTGQPQPEQRLREPASLGPRPEGRGLGVYLAQLVAQRHGGWLSTGGGRGGPITLHLPAAGVARAQVAPADP
ncbi:MAG: hypothetical protein VKM01_07175 [Cyanobacteriota bacterium]|nr:hypothetical protein [Cyanobacteriota bacterium]